MANAPLLLLCSTKLAAEEKLVACRWEDHHPTLSVGRFLEDMKFKPLAWLAWDALRTKKIVVPLFSTWVENVMDITFLPKAKQGPQEEPQT